MPERPLTSEKKRPKKYGWETKGGGVCCRGNVPNIFVAIDLNRQSRFRGSGLFGLCARNLSVSQSCLWFVDISASVKPHTVVKMYLNST
jgi:hypothetical protein